MSKSQASQRSEPAFLFHYCSAHGSIALTMAGPLLLIATGGCGQHQSSTKSSDLESFRQGLGFVSLALKNYDSVYGHLPYLGIRTGSLDRSEPVQSEGQLLYSWRVEVVPFLCSWHGSWDASKPWNDPANKQLVELSSCYAFNARKSEPWPATFPKTNLLAITGPGTAFGALGEKPRSLTEIPSATILAVETRSSDLPWPAPGDFDIRTMPKTIGAADGSGISGVSTEGFHVIFADSQLWFLSHEVPFELLKQFFTIEGAKAHDREQVLAPFVLHRGV